MFWWIFWIAYGLIGVGWTIFWGRTLPELRAELLLTFTKSRGLSRSALVERQNRMLLLYGLNWALVLCAPAWPVLTAFLIVDEWATRGAMRHIVKNREEKN